MLKRQKGFSIATKSVKTKLLRSGFDMQPTKIAYNEVVHFYLIIIAEDPQGINIPTKDNGGWRYYELLTWHHEFVAGFPSPLKRAAIRQAIGAYQSWNSSYQKLSYQQFSQSQNLLASWAGKFPISGEV